jgi:arylsulfatase
LLVITRNIALASLFILCGTEAVVHLLCTAFHITSTFNDIFLAINFPDVMAHSNPLIFYRLLILLLLIQMAGCARKPAVVSAPPAPEKPNIIIIMADDMGFSDLGCFGSEIHTPNIDRLANRGLIMTQFYNTSRCCPSRAALLTGVYQHQAGIGRMTADQGLPAYRGFLNDRVVTIAEVLKASGYHTMMTGKWHVGSEPAHWPHRRGFDRFYGSPRGGGVYFHPFFQDHRPVVLDSSIIQPDSMFYSTDAFNDYAVQFIDEQKDSGQPFFLYVAHIAPHFPLQAWERDIARYRGKYAEGFEVTRHMRFREMKALGLLSNGLELSPADEGIVPWDQLSDGQKDTLDLKMAIYAAQIERMDMGIGDIIDKLLELQIMEHTAIFFLSDNGASHERVHRTPRGRDGKLGSRDSFVSVGRSWANVSNTPFRMYKHWVHEGGISTPMIFHYPALLRGPLRTDYPGHIMDIMPTCLELADAKHPAQYSGSPFLPLQGESLLPAFEGKAEARNKPLFWEHMGNRAVRNGSWKLVSKYENGKVGKWELYNIDQDRTELKDLSATNPDIVQQLSGLYEQWATNVGVVLPHELSER